MPRPLHWALLGTARINRLLIPAIRSSSRSTLVAVASRDLARAEAYANEWKIDRAIGSYEELLEAAIRRLTARRAYTADVAGGSFRLARVRLSETASDWCVHDISLHSYFR